MGRKQKFRKHYVWTTPYQRVSCPHCGKRVVVISKLYFSHVKATAIVLKKGEP